MCFSCFALLQSADISRLFHRLDELGDPDGDEQSRQRFVVSPQGFLLHADAVRNATHRQVVRLQSHAVLVAFYRHFDQRRLAVHSDQSAAGRPLDVRTTTSGSVVAAGVEGLAAADQQQRFDGTEVETFDDGLRARRLERQCRGAA